MQFGSISERCWDVSYIIQRAEEGGVTIQQDGTVPMGDDANMAKLGALFDLTIVPMTQGIDIPTLKSALRKAPVTIFGTFNYPSRRTPLGHAIVVCGMFGDGTAANTVCTVIDPFNANTGENMNNDLNLTWVRMGQVLDRIDYLSKKL